MAAAATVAVILPGAFYTLRETRLPPIALMRQHGLRMAVATDCNPGTAPMTSLTLAMNMACTLFRMTPDEALAGVTLHAAAALGLSDRGRIAPGLRAEVFPTLIQQSTTNLVLNALDAVRDGGHVEVRLGRDADAIVIEVDDDGPGVPEADRERIFDPFFTTKTHGTGLGLVSVRTCAQLHGGDVTIARSQALGGAAFRVTLRRPAARLRLRGHGGAL